MTGEILKSYLTKSGFSSADAILLTRLEHWTIVARQLKSDALAVPIAA